jgi:hypothetical protein
MKRPNVAQTLAMRAAAAAAAQDEEERQSEPPAEGSAPASAPQAARGRPRGKRPVAARQTIYLDEARHAALTRLAEDRGRSVHSLIIEGIDHVIGKPMKVGWE